MIRFLHVGKRLGAEWAMVRFSLEAPGGEFTWLEGPPGSGKSLAVRLALGEELATTGSVDVDGVNPAKLRGAERRAWRRGLSAVLDDEAPLDLPAADWVAFGPWCAGRAWSAAQADARAALDRHGLGSLARRLQAALSRGQRLQLALTRALLRRPHVLLVDWAGWTDAPLPASLAGDVRALVAEGGTCLAAGSPGGAAAEWGGRRAAMTGAAE